MSIGDDTEHCPLVQTLSCFDLCSSETKLNIARIRCYVYPSDSSAFSITLWTRKAVQSENFDSLPARSAPEAAEWEDEVLQTMLLKRKGQKLHEAK